MFKTDHAPTLRGDAKRAAIVDAALSLFRARGFDAVTMRDVAKSAGIATGAAYYYFPSKESLVLDYYNTVQIAHRSAVVAALPAQADLEARIRTVLRTKLELVRPDRRLLGALFRYVAEADHPLSVFGKAAHDTREHAIATFLLAFAGEVAPTDALGARAAWLAHLGLILYLVSDQSEGQMRTFRLADRVASLLALATNFAHMPGAAFALVPLVDALVEAGLVPPKTQETA